MLPALPRADSPLRASAPAAIPAEAHATPLTLAEWPLDRLDSTHATSLPLEVRVSLAWPSKSGMLKAIEGIWLAYSSGTVISPLAEKVPDGTRRGVV